MKNFLRNIGLVLIALIALPCMGLAQQPVADFTADITSGCSPLKVNFKDLSTNSPTGWNWDVGNGTYTQQNPEIVYSVAGTYAVKLTVTNANGSGTVTKEAFIHVYASPKVNFFTADTVGCAPLTSSFRDLTTSESSIKTWQWNFGDGVKSTDQNPVHTFSANGFFNVSLVVISANGCTDTLKRNPLIRSIKPAVQFSNLPGGGCVPFTLQPAYTITSADPVTSYSWDFGDGKTSTTATPLNTYSTTGVYTVKLNITTSKGCTQAIKIDSAVQVGNKVSVDFTANAVQVCSSKPVTFTSVVTGGKATGYLWNFGDTKTDTAQNPKHLYRDTGSFSVKLDVNSGGCISSVTKLNIIQTKGPVSIFDFTKDCANRGKVVFNNRSIIAETYKWDFDDGQFSTEISPEHTYTAAKSYNVKLITTNSNGCTDTAVVAVPIWFNKLDVETNRDTLCKGGRAVITMRHPSPASVVKYIWNYGPNQTIETPGDNNPTGWDYTESGDHSFTGISIDIFGCRDTVFKSTLVRVNGPAPDFTADNIRGCKGMLVIFSDLSKTDGLHSLKKWDWDFGDGSTVQTYTAPPFTHTYTKGGSFSVKLTVTDASGCLDSYTKNDFIYTGDGKADFTIADSFTCLKAVVTFSNQSGGGIISYLWDFGDGQTSAEENPLHTYKDSGLYTVKLKTLASSGCTDSLIKKDVVTVKNPKAKLSFSTPSITCAPLPIQFTDSSYYTKSRLWYFGDGDTSTSQKPLHTFKNPGAYQVKLISTSQGGCKDSITTTVVVNGVTGKLTYSPLTACQNLKVDFKAESNSAISFDWDFNDGTTLSAFTSIVSHTYTKPGVYVPTVLLKDAAGCSMTVKGTDTIRSEGSSPMFTSNTRLICDSGNVSFLDNTQKFGGSVSYKWKFGDGGISSLQNPVHKYGAPGNYSVKLITSTPSGCTDSIEVVNYIKTVSSPAGAITGDSTGCAPATLNITATLVPDTSAITSWKWSFGNGNTSAQQYPPPQLFTSPGNYNNSLVVTNSSGCSTVINKKAVIYPSFLTVNKNTAICKGDSIRFMASGAASYSWSSSGSSLSCTACATPVSYPQKDELFKLHAIAASGCTADDSVFVRVLQPFKLSVSNSNINLCAGDKILLQASGAPLYTWSPSTALSSTGISNPTASPVINTTYKVVGYDSLGCFKDSALINVNVNAVPSVDAGPDLVLAPGSSKILSPKVSSDVISYSWSPVTGLSCSTCQNPALTASSNATYVLKVINNANCAALDAFKLIVSCNNSSVYVPNTFSPNADGMNDQFYPRGTGNFTISYLKIFNRWGETMFEKRNVTVNDPSQGWNGTYKGKTAADGVYTYYMEVICTDSKILKYIGNVTLIQ